MRIAVLGAGGQLGTDLRMALAEHDVHPLLRADADVTDTVRLRAVLDGIRPDIVINTTAFHRVDDCERNAGPAFHTNAAAPLALSRIANDLDAILMHVSTDYVFGGESTQPYTESDRPFPLSVYAQSKLAGEYAVQSTARRFLLIRTCGLFGVAGSRGKPGNFVETMLRRGASGDALRVVADQIVTPTATRDLARQIAVLIGSGQTGLFHITAQGQCSWFEFASTIFEMARLKADLKPVTAAEFRAPARRPAYSVLDNARLKSLGLDRMRPWKTGLADYLHERSCAPG